MQLHRRTGFNSQPPEGGWGRNDEPVHFFRKFQLTAARRRLVKISNDRIDVYDVSTHSRPKAAGVRLSVFPRDYKFQLTAARRRLEDLARGRLAGARFNSQPPEGGWLNNLFAGIGSAWFQLTAARRRLVPPLKPLTGKACIALFR